jgi:hypothetical protein
MCIMAALPALGALAGGAATTAGVSAAVGGIVVPTIAAGATAASGLATAGLIASGIGTAASVYGKIQEGKAQSNQYKYQAAVDRNNQIISTRQADDAIQRGKIEEENVRRRTQAIKGEQRAAYAANGIDLGSDAVVDTLADTAMLGELDALTTRSNAEREAYGFRVQGMNYGASAQNNTMAAKNTKSASRIGAMTTLLSGASTVASSYSDYKTKGVFA